jgi:hypothetical protein
MKNTTRIASLLYPGFDRIPQSTEHLWRRDEEIRALLRRRLPAVTASLLARAQPVAAQPGRIDWYSDLAGQPNAFEELSNDEQARVIALVEDRLQSIRQLAEELETAPTPSPAMAAVLRHAARYPDPRCIYLVDNEPVLTYWGLDAPRQATLGPRAFTEPPAPGAPLSGMRPVLLAALALLVLGGIAFGAWIWWQEHLRAQLQAELEAGLAAQCEPTTLLEALLARLERIDPDGARLPTLRLDTERELNRCADAADLDARLDAAWDDCAELPLLADALVYQDLNEPPFAALKARLDTRQADCRLAADLRLRLSSAAGDCDAIVALAVEHQALRADDYPLAGPSAEVAAEAAACRLSAELRPRLAKAGGDCWALRKLDRELGQRIASGADGRVTLDLSRAPLAALYADLDAALQRCALADHLAARFAEAHGDCVDLFSLRETLSRHDTVTPPLDGIARQLDEALAQCAALSELEASFTQVQGQCEQVAAFSGELERWRDNLRFADIRARVATEQGICEQAHALVQRIADLGMDCTRLRELTDVVAESPGTHFDRARATLKARLTECDTRTRYARRLKDAGSHCGRLKALQRELKRETSAYLKPTRQRLAQALKPCQSKSRIAKPPRGGGAYALSGQCSGNLVLSPARGYHGDRIRHTVTIAPPGNARIARVVSDNPGCRNCRLTKRSATTWSVGLFYNCGGTGPVPVAYSAYDRSGKLVCSGRGACRCLGRRR